MSNEALARVLDSDSLATAGTGALGTAAQQAKAGAASLLSNAAPDASSSLWRLVAALAVVLVLIFVLQYLARRFGTAGRAAKGGTQIDILAQRQLGSRLSLAVVQVMDRSILVGISPRGVQHLADLDGSAGRARELAEAAARLEAWPGTGTASKQAPSPVPAWMAKLLAAVRASFSRPRSARAVRTPATPPAKPRTAADDFASELETRLATLTAGYPSLLEVEQETIRDTAPSGARA